MKKLLAASSALVAVAGFAGAAQAADPIKLSLGGFGYGSVTYYDADHYYTGGARNDDAEVNNFVVNSDHEVHIKGSTTLDNGLTVGVKYELRTGGRGTGSDTNNVDEYSLTVSGGYGTMIIGAEDAATEAVAITAPHMGGRLLGAGLSEGSMISGSFVQNPGVALQPASFINSSDEQLVSYISPELAGFTFGASYVPDIGAGQDSTNLIKAGNVADLYGVGALWAGEFSGVGIKASAGYATADGPADDWSQWQGGLGFTYAGFTLSGGYSAVNEDQDAGSDTDSNAWEIGIGYETGPYGIALGYYSSTVDGAGANVSTVSLLGGNGVATGADDDEVDAWQLTSSYAMGPGVSLVGGIGWVDFDNGESGAAKVENDGVVVQTGIMLSF